MIAIGAGAVLGLLVLNQVVLNPYLDQRKKLEASIAAAQAQIDANKKTDDLQIAYRRVWNTMLQAGMKTTPAEAGGQLERAVRDWALRAKVTPTETKLDQMPVEKGYQKYKYHFTGVGGQPAVATMIWSIETTQLPVRVDDVTISAVKEGTDNLKVEMNILILCPVPDAGAAKTTLADARGV